MNFTIDRSRLLAGVFLFLGTLLPLPAHAAERAEDCSAEFERVRIPEPAYVASPVTFERDADRVRIAATAATAADLIHSDNLNWYRIEDGTWRAEIAGFELEFSFRGAALKKALHHVEVEIARLELSSSKHDLSPRQEIRLLEFYLQRSELLDFQFLSPDKVLRPSVEPICHGHARFEHEYRRFDTAVLIPDEGSKPSTKSMDPGQIPSEHGSRWHRPATPLVRSQSLYSEFGPQSNGARTTYAQADLCRDGDGDTYCRHPLPDTDVVEGRSSTLTSEVTADIGPTWQCEARAFGYVFVKGANGCVDIGSFSSQARCDDF